VRKWGIAPDVVPVDAIVEFREPRSGGLPNEAMAIVAVILPRRTGRHASHLATANAATHRTPRLESSHGP
jgi:hypothetical protein